MTSQEDLRAIALEEFAMSGFGATSIQRIAELAGLSKSSVLYHFASKEALLEAVVAPSIERMTGLMDSIDGAPFTADRRAEFIPRFVDFLLEHRLEVHTFINQGQSLHEVPVVQRANELVGRMAGYFCSTASSTEDQMRFAMALGGAAYTLVNDQPKPGPPAPIEETRAALITIMSELLASVQVRSPQPTEL